jgi:hypothetical protein
MFQLVQNFVPEWNPTAFLSDYEIGAIEAIREIMPGINTYGCLFHFCQSIYRQIQMLPNLNALFRDDDDVKAKIKSLFSLAFLDVPFVYEHFCLLMKTFPEIEEVESTIIILYNEFSIKFRANQIFCPKLDRM